MILLLFCVPITWQGVLVPAFQLQNSNGMTRCQSIQEKHIRRLWNCPSAATPPFRLCYTFDDENDNNGEPTTQPTHDQPIFTMDTSQILSDPAVKASIFAWLASLPNVERSDPTWLPPRFLTTLSPSALLQEHLESLLPLHTLPSSNSISSALFPTEWSRHKFDCDWREGFLKTMPSDILEELDDSNEQCPTSNTHPLRLQLVAIPPDTSLRQHVHAAVECNVPLLGDLWEKVPVDGAQDILLPAETLQRPLDLQIGTPLNLEKLSEQPTRKELQMVSQRLGNDLAPTLQQLMDDTSIELEERVISEGQCLVNVPGSIHQSFTKAGNEESNDGDKHLRGGCLLWALGPNVHVHFPSNGG